MNAQGVIVVILAYGLWGPSKRTPKEKIGYGMYLENCINALRYLTACNHNVHLIICGGATENGVTESQSLYEYIKTRVSDLPILYSLDTLSLTTPANIWQAYGIIRDRILPSKLAELRYKDHSLIFLCDKPRELKVKWLLGRYHTQERRRIRREWQTISDRAAYYLDILKTAEVQAFERPDISVKSTKIFQFIETLIMMLVPGVLTKRINKLREV